MNTRFYPIAGMVCLLWITTVSLAQVDEIKKRSSEHSRGRSSGSGDNGSSSSSSFSSFFVVDIMFNGIASWQGAKLQKRDEVPQMVSFDLMLQTAIRPATYYVVHPRVRGNWGLFSTDFRFNYLVEEDVEGAKHLRTDDWQILQLNIVTARNFGLRIGGGIMHEAFSGGKTFSEGTLGVNGQSDDQQIGGMMEYRWAEVRKEWSAQFQYMLFQHKALHGFATLGVVFQRYYDSVDVWGVQGGVVFKVFRAGY